MKIVRCLLTQGNSKVGASIHLWSIPAIKTCPGSTELCRSVCYADSGRYLFKYLRDRLEWCLKQSKRADFVRRMIAEIKRKEVLVLRIHCAGDFMNRGYAEKWLSIMKACPRVRFYFYTRSWRIPEIAEVLEQMAALRCCRAWYSLDRETGLPERIPPGVKLAYLQVDADEEPELMDLRFVVRRLKRHAQRVSLPMLCPHQSGKQENCGSCCRCFH